VIELLSISPGDNVLDVGCGTGNMAIRLARCYPQVRVTGVDLSPGMINVAQSKSCSIVNVSFMIAAVEHLPLTSASFDLVLSTLSFHHWSDTQAGLAECHRVLKPGGRLIVVDITGDSRFVGLYGLFAPTPRIVSCRHYAKSAQIYSYFRKIGLSNVTQVKVSLLPKIVLTSGEKARR
jgi:ubiquinone/menaquinone biosynthesis C-methylase UbiE